MLTPHGSCLYYAPGRSLPAVSGLIRHTSPPSKLDKHNYPLQAKRKMSATLFMIEYFQNRISGILSSNESSNTSTHGRSRTSKNGHCHFHSLPKMHKRKPQTSSTPNTQEIKGILKKGRDSLETLTDSDESFKAGL